MTLVSYGKRYFARRFDVLAELDAGGSTVEDVALEGVICTVNNDSTKAKCFPR